MNSKKILSMLLLGLGAFTLTLSGCKNNNGNSNSETTTSTSEKTSETTTSSSEATSSSEDVTPEAKTWEVAFNVDVPKEELTVWTDFAIDKSIGVELGDATTKANMTGKDLTGRTTVPLDRDPGMYYFAVDADGYLVYAGYGLGAGYSSPSDGYYHNLDAADPYSMNFWALNDQFETWPTWSTSGQKKVEVNGVKQYTFNLYNFVIPEGGFVVKGYLTEQSLKEFFKELVGENPLTEVGYGCAGAFDKQYNSQWGKATIEPKALDKYYFYINENHELALRERTEEELKDSGGEQLKDTPSHGTLTADDELEKFASIADVLALSDGAAVTNAKGVITYVNDNVAYVQDANGNTIRVSADAIKDANVKDTIAFDGTLATVKGQPQVNATKVRTITGYGTVSAIATTAVTVDNVNDFVGLKNNLKKVKITKAEVKETNKVVLGDVEFTVDTELTVGDFVDFTGFYTFEDSKNVIHTVEDIAKYYKITVNVGDTVETKSAAKGEVVEFSPEKADSAYTFVKWQVKNADGEWEDVTTDRDLKVTVGESDVEYQAVFEYAPWASLVDYEQFGTATVQSTSKDTPLTVWTSEDFALSGDWEKGSINASWRTIVAVDAEGKVAYAVFCPANGYGGPSGTGYYAHADYADYTKNPAIRLLEGYGPWTKEDPSASMKFEIIVPKGGFLITSYNDDKNNLLCANTMVNMVTKGAMTAAGNDFNKRNPAYDDVRIFFDKTNNEVKAFKERSINVMTGDDEVVVDGTGYTIAVDKDGKVIYASYGLTGNYGSPTDGFYHDGTWTQKADQTWGPFIVDKDWKPWAPGDDSYKKYTVIVPEGGMLISDTAEKLADFIKELTGKNVADYTGNKLFEEEIKVGSLNTKVVKYENGKLTVVDTNAKDYKPITYTDSKYQINYFDSVREKVNAKEATETLVSSLVSEIFYDNENAQMWADSGFSSIVYTDNAIFQSKTSAWGGNVMVVNKDGKIEYIGTYGGNSRAMAKDNYYLRANNVNNSPAVDENNNICIPEGGFAIQVWFGTNANETHKLAYSGYDVIRSFVLASMGTNYFKVDTIPTDHVVGNTGSEATKAYGENNTLAVKQGEYNIIFSNIYTGYLDYLTVTRETVEDVYFKGKLVVSATDTLESIVQRSLAKTEYIRTVINNDETFASLYDTNKGGVNWGLDNAVLPEINKYINGECTHETAVNQLKAFAMGTSYLGDTYKALWENSGLTVY